MDIILTVLCIIVAFLYFRFFLKRLRLLLSLKKAAKRSDSKLTLATPMFWLPTNRGKRCELLETANGRQVIPFYLLSPANSPIHITKNNGDTIVDLLPGSKIDNILFADREYLFQYIQLSLHTRPAKKYPDI